MKWGIAFTVLMATLVAGWMPAAFAGQVAIRRRIAGDHARPDRGRLAAAGRRARRDVRPRAGVTPEQDAAGGCDGVKTGEWGFHTAEETNPWWQVDLGKSAALDRVVIYNRCDAFADRNSRIMVLLSSDARSFKQAYQHDGTVFGGQPDNHPLLVPTPRPDRPLCPSATAGPQLLPSGRGRGLRGRRQGESGPRSPGDAVERQPVVGRARQAERGFQGGRLVEPAAPGRPSCWSAASSWPRTCGSSGRSIDAEEKALRDAAVAAACGRRLAVGAEARPISKPAGPSADWRCATRFWISIRSCSSSTPRAGSRTCPTSSTAGGRGRAAGSSCSKASRATGRSCDA